MNRGQLDRGQELVQYIEQLNNNIVKIKSSLKEIGKRSKNWYGTHEFEMDGDLIRKALKAQLKREKESLKSAEFELERL